MCREKDVKAVDLRFMDFPGLWQHFTIPVGKLDEDVFEDGLGFDGSSIRGWQAINESDMLVVPQPETAFLDPFTELPTLVDDLQHPGPDHARGLHARSAQRRPQGGQLPARAPASPTPPTSVRKPSSSSSTTFASTRMPTAGFYYVDSIEGEWNRGREERPEPGLQAAPQGRLFPGSAGRSDDGSAQRDDADDDRLRAGRRMPASRSGTAGQSEIDLRFDELVKMADNMMMYKYIIKNVAARHNKTVTFMPKPLFGDNGSGMHTHISLWKDGEPLFAGNGYAGLSEMALYAIGGMLQACPGHPGVHQPDDQQLQAAGARATKPRSTWPIRSATARRPAAFRCTAPARRRSGSSSAARIRAAIRTWPSPRC